MASRFGVFSTKIMPRVPVFSVHRWTFEGVAILEKLTRGTQAAAAHITSGCRVFHMLIHVTLIAVACESTILHVKNHMKTREDDPAESCNLQVVFMCFSCVFHVFCENAWGPFSHASLMYFHMIFQVFSHAEYLECRNQVSLASNLEVLKYPKLHRKLWAQRALWVFYTQGNIPEREQKMVSLTIM